MIGRFSLKNLLFFIILIVLTSPYSVLGQNAPISGRIVERSANGVSKPLPGANVYWLGTTVGTFSDKDGRFSLKTSDVTNRLIISYIGYGSDTVKATSSDPLEVSLTSLENLKEVTVTGQAEGLSRREVIKTETIGQRELQKAACCNLSESFSTNATVDVSFSDAVTGARQIRMLGLDGAYVQIMTENIPTVRGLSNNFGLTYIPGTWVHAIDIGVGAGSVVNGYEAMAGQINVELIKPEDSKPVLFNAYVNSVGRSELNLVLAKPINKRWDAGLLLHGSNLSNRVDMNDDGFMDTPLYTQLNLINRYKYSGEKVNAQLGVKVLNDRQKGGQTAFRESDRATTTAYGTAINTERYEVFGKLGLPMQSRPGQSLGLLVSASLFDRDTYFGHTNYRGTEKTLYTNLTYETFWGTTDHKFRTGVSYLYDDFDETLNDSDFQREESVPGAFLEYTDRSIERLTVVAGIRADFHNLYGEQYSPRLHLKYDITDHWSARGSAGRGFRVPNAIGENLPLLVSSRTIDIMEPLRPEVSWNYGGSLTHFFKILGKNGNIDVEFYRTEFQNQMVVDRYASEGRVSFYNLNGRSFANSYKAEIFVWATERLGVKAAFKQYDVRTTIGGTLREVPLVARNRILLNLSYATEYDIWRFDLTANRTGRQRLPNTEETAAGALSPSFITLNAQVTKAFRKWELYVGMENVTGYKQNNPIINAQTPFGADFDAASVWGPIIGRMAYLGVRLPVSK